MEWYLILIPASGILLLLFLYLFYYRRNSILSAIFGDSSPSLDVGTTSYARVQNTKSEPMWIPNKGVAYKVKHQIEQSGHDAKIVSAGKNGYYIYTRPSIIVGGSKYKYTEPLRARSGKDSVIITLLSKENPREVKPREIEIEHAKILKRK